MKRNKNDWRAFLKLPYNLPKVRAGRAQGKARLDPLQSNHCSELVAAKKVNKELASDLYQAKQDLEKTTMKKDLLSEKLLEEKRKCKNRYKQMKRREVNIEQQKKQISLLSDALTDKMKKCEVQEKRYVKAVAAKERYRSKANYAGKLIAQAKTKNAKIHDELCELQEEFYSNVNDLQEVIKNKENDYDEIRLENENLIETQSKKILPTFDSGKFNDSIRQCCIELLSLNVGIRNVEPIIRSVVYNVVGVDVDRLPKYSTLVKMLSEMKVIAYQQLSEELAECQYTTLH